jgi:glycogen debranching enzyme
MKEAHAKLSGIYRDRNLFRLFDDNTPSSAINHVLFRCEHEEHDISASKRGTYGLTNYGQFPYSGLTSFMHTLDKLKVSKDMGNELFDNLRAGDWYIDYATNRISLYAAEEPSIGLQRLSAFMQDYFGSVKQLPSYMKPKMASRVIEAIYRQVIKHVMSTQMLDDFVGDSEDPFVQKLALATY